MERSAQNVWCVTLKTIICLYMAQPCHTDWKKTVYWKQWLMKGICNVNDLYSDGAFISFSELMQKYDLESKEHFWKFL